MFYRYELLLLYLKINSFFSVALRCGVISRVKYITHSRLCAREWPNGKSGCVERIVVTKMNKNQVSITKIDSCINTSRPSF